MGSEDEGELRARRRAQRVVRTGTRRLPNGQYIPTPLIHLTNRDFRKAFDRLRPGIKEQTKRRHRLLERKPGAKKLDLWSPFDAIWRAEVGYGYRAVGEMYAVPVITWLWVGPHEGYDDILDDLRANLT